MKATQTPKKAEDRFAATSGSKRVVDMQARLEMIREAAQRRSQNRRPQPMYGVLVMDNEFLQ